MTPSPRKSKATFSPASFSKVVKDFSSPTHKLQKIETPIACEVENTPNELYEKQTLNKNRPTFYISSASLSEVTDSVSSSFPEENLEMDHPQIVDMKRTSNHIPSQHSLVYSNTECDDDDYSEYSEDSESCYGESWSYTPSPMFRKVLVSSKPLSVHVNSHNTFQSKQKSLLSAALSKRRPKSVLNKREMPRKETQTNDISSSLKETLLWDRVMPFNTTIYPYRKFKSEKANGIDWNDDLDNCW